MARGPVDLNGNKYAVAGPIIEYVVDQLASATPTAAGQFRSSNRKVNTLVLGDDLSGGFGGARWNVEKGTNATRFRDSTCDTRFQGFVVMGLLNEASTALASLQRTRASALFKSDIWVLGDTGTANQARTAVYTGSTTTWTITTNNPAGFAATVIPQDIIPYLDSILIGVADNAPSLKTRSVTSKTAAWSTPTTDLAGFTINTPGANADGDYLRLCVVRGEKVAVIWDEANGQITFNSGTSAGGNWADETINIASGNGPQGVAVMTDGGGNEYLWVATREGLWEVDTSPATWTARLRVPMTPHNDNGRWMTVHNGDALYVGVGVGNFQPAPMWRITYQNTGAARKPITETNLGLDQADGVPSELYGPITRMKSVGEMLFAAVGGGAASRNARILCYYKGGWHSMFRNGTANQKIWWIDVSSDDDGTTRLHYAIRTGGATETIAFLGQPVAHPASGVTFKRQASGYIEFPEVVLMPQNTGAIIKAIMDATGASSTETMALLTDINGVSPPTTSRGTFNDTTTSIGYGTSSRGLSGRTFNIRLNFAGSGDATATMRELEIWIKKNLKALRGWIVPIDIEATSLLGSKERVPTETIWTNIDAVINSDTLVNFQIGNMAATNVECVDTRDWQTEVAQETRERNLGRRTGKVTLILEELK